MPKLNLYNDVNLFYSVTGKGTPIIFIHPPVITSANFAYQIEELSQDFHIITFDILIAIGNANTKEMFQLLFSEARKGDIRNMEQYFRCSLEYYCTDRLGDIPHPVLLIYGKKDGSFHRYAQLLHENLPYNEIRFMDESHRIPTKSAKDLNTYIRQFCSGHAPK